MMTEAGEQGHFRGRLLGEGILADGADVLLILLRGRRTAIHILFLFDRLLRFRGLFHAPILHRHAAVLMPALLPVALLAPHAAVIGAHAAAAGLVHGDAGDASLGCAAVGAVLEGGRGGGAVFLLFLGRFGLVASSSSSSSSSS